MNDNEELEYFKSEQFRQDFAQQVTKDTWGNGLPKIYMNDSGDIVEHWKDGTINVLKTKKELETK